MRLQDVEQYKDDLPAALERSIADVPELEAKLAEAEKNLAAAETERQRQLKAFGRLHSSIPVLFEKQKAAKLRAMELSASGLDDQSAWQAHTRTKNDRDHAIAAFHYVSLYPMEDAVRNSLLAEINERQCFADLCEARAVRARVGMLAAAASASQYDPGVQIDTKESWSHREAEKAAHIRERLIPGLREQLEIHDSRVARQRADSGASLWA